MDALEKLQEIVNKLMTADGEEKEKLLAEAKDLMGPAKEQVEISERMKRVELEHQFGITSED